MTLAVNGLTPLLIARLDHQDAIARLNLLKLIKVLISFFLFFVDLEWIYCLFYNTRVSGGCYVILYNFTLYSSSQSR